MKLIIDIDKEIYESSKRECAENDDLIIDTFTLAIGYGTPIPDNATNDDVLKALFDERGYMGIHDRMMHIKWLFAPYIRKAVKNDNNT